MNYVSFSLFGSNPTYTTGCLKNALLMPQIYKGWTMTVYHDETVPKPVLNELKALGVDLRKNDLDIKNEMFARFLIADDPTMERFIVRDADSRIGPREKACVDEWVKSGLPFHSLRDHIFHTLPLGGGLWGATKGAIKGNMKDLIVKSKMADRNYDRSHSYGADQMFLAFNIWPYAKRRCLQHDSCNRHIYPDSKPLPSGCSFYDFGFVGESWTADDKPDRMRREQRVNFMSV